MHGIFFEPPIDRYYLGHQFSEVYKDKVYEPFFKDKRNLIIIDVGANIGVTTYYFSRFAKKVYSLEPSMEHFKVLSEMVKYNKLDNIELFKKAIWMKNGEQTFYHNKGNATVYSLHGAVQDKKSLPEKVESVTIDRFYEDNKIEHCDFLKVDAEGSEFEILGSTGFKKIAKITDVVFLEWHKWAKRNPAQLVQSLKLNGYTMQVPQGTSTDLIVGIKNEKSTS